MSSTTRFSVVIPVYNGESHLAQSIQSALAQEQLPHEIIVVDDGSTDSTDEIARGFGNQVKYLQQTNQGCAAARNLGVQHSSGDYIAFLDGDDIWYPWTLRIVRELIQQNHEPAVIATAIHHFSDSNPPELECPESSDWQSEYFQDMLCFGYVIGTCILIVRRDVFEKAEGFVPLNMNGTDAEFNLRVGNEPGFVRILQPPMLAYRQHGENVTHNYRKSWEGLTYMIKQERSQRYPGGRERHRDRIGFITRQTRPFSLRLLTLGQRGLAAKVFMESLLWNLLLGRWKYLLGFPFVFVLSFFRKKNPHG